MIKAYTAHETAAQLGIGALDLSFKTPKWLRNLASKVTARLPKGTTVQVDPGNGVPITVDVTDPNSVAELRKTLANASFKIGGKPPRVMDSVNDALTGIPPIVLVALGAGALFLFSRRRRRA